MLSSKQHSYWWIFQIYIVIRSRHNTTYPKVRWSALYISEPTYLVYRGRALSIHIMDQANNESFWLIDFSADLSTW